MFTVFFALFTISLGARAAFADDTKKDDKPKVKNYDFDADDIDGELIKPEGEFVKVRKFAEHRSLIRVRQDFIKEIVKSAENL
jgi:hypothetical protein